MICSCREKAKQRIEWFAQMVNNSVEQLLSALCKQLVNSFSHKWFAYMMMKTTNKHTVIS